jgi:polysaccharide export outer membrane protein
MKSIKENLRSAILGLFACALLMHFLPGQVAGMASDAGESYRLGPEDQISIHVMDLDKLQLDGELAPKVDINGDLNLPLIGNVHAAGLTLIELKAAISAKVSNILQAPVVSAAIVQYRSHPVSVLGAVRNPGVIQVTQQKRLLEVLSMAGGLAPEAGDKIKISRRKSAGILPLSGVISDESSEYYVGSVDVKPLIEATNPKLNIEILENDVISVTAAELVFVMGAVKKPGGFSLGQREHMSVLQALSLAEGTDRAASPKTARLLREDAPGKDRHEIAINLKPIMNGSAPDVPLQANDILYIPVSGAKLATLRSLEAAVQMGTGFAVFH